MLGARFDFVDVLDFADERGALLDGKLDVRSIGPVDFLQETVDVVQGDGVVTQAVARLRRVSDLVDGASVYLVAPALLWSVMAREFRVADGVLRVLKSLTP